VSVTPRHEVSTIRVSGWIERRLCGITWSIRSRGWYWLVVITAAPGHGQM